MCRGRDGAHVNEDHFLVEVVDPQSGEPLPDGEVGELVFSTLTKEALPLLRYRTGDLASVTREPCACGRTFARMSRVLGRTDDMLIIRGVNVFPSEIERALLAIPGAAPHYQLVVERPGHLDELTVQVEGTVDAAVVRKRLHSVLGLTARVEVVPPGSVPRSEGKALRVVDRRARPRPPSRLPEAERVPFGVVAGREPAEARHRHLVPPRRRARAPLRATRRCRRCRSRP